MLQASTSAGASLATKYCKSSVVRVGLKLFYLSAEAIVHSGWSGGSKMSLDEEFFASPLREALNDGRGRAEALLGLEKACTHLGARRASIIKENLSKEAPFSTGCAGLDELLGGGVKLGIVTLVAGESGVGKSQIAFQLAALSSGLRGPVMFADATGTFRPERIVSVCRARGLDFDVVLKNILVVRVSTIEDQLALVGQARQLCSSKGVKLLVIDTLTDVFAEWLAVEDVSLEKRSQLALHLNQLAHLAADLRIGVFITNGIRERFTPFRHRVEVGGSTVTQALHARIMLERSDNRFYAMRLYPPPVSRRRYYSITEAGVVGAENE